MAGPGGRRAGSGAKKGQQRVHVLELRAAIEKSVGMPFQDILALTYSKLFNDFQIDKNVKEYLIFTENMSKRILADQAQEVNVNNPLQDLTKEEIQERIAAIMSPEADAQDCNGENDTQ